MNPNANPDPWEKEWQGAYASRRPAVIAEYWYPVIPSQFHPTARHKDMAGIVRFHYKHSADPDRRELTAYVAVAKQRADGQWSTPEPWRWRSYTVDVPPTQRAAVAAIRVAVRDAAARRPCPGFIYGLSVQINSNTSGTGVVDYQNPRLTRAENYTER